MVSPLWTAEIVWHDIALASAFWEDFSWSPGGFLHEFTVAPPPHSFVTLELIGRTCPGGSTFAWGAVERGTAKSWSLHQPVALTGPDLVSEVMFSGCPLFVQVFWYYFLFGITGGGIPMFGLCTLDQKCNIFLCFTERAFYDELLICFLCTCTFGS